MIGEFIEILLLFNNLEQAIQKKAIHNQDFSDDSDDIDSEASQIRKALEEDREIQTLHNSYLARELQQEACNNEFTSQFYFNVRSHENSQTVLAVLESKQLESKQLESKQLESKQFDVLIWDDFSPSVENLAIISQINSQVPHLAIIIIGKGNDEQTIMQTLQLGAQDYLDRNEITPKLLLKSILRAIGRQKQRSLQLKPNLNSKLLVRDRLTSVTNKKIINNKNENNNLTKNHITNDKRNDNHITKQYQWRELSNLTFEGLLILDGKKIINANHILASIIGYRIEELIGKNFFDIVAQDSQELFWNHILSNCETPTEIVIKTKENNKFCVELQTKIIDEFQTDLRLLVIKDISQRKQTEATLKKRENCLRKQSRTLVELARSKTLLRQGNLNVALREITEAAARTLELERISIWLYNQDHSNLECIDLYELSKKHHSCGTIFVKANYPAYFQALATERTIDVRDALNDLKTCELKSYLESHDILSILYAPIWLWGRLVGVVSCEQVHEVRHWTLEEENFAGSIADFVSLAIEASDRAATEKALRRSEGKLRAIFERSSIGIGLIDMSTRIVETNPALCMMLGYSQDQMHGKRFTDYISPDELKSDLELYQQLIAGTCDRSEMERRFVRRDGRIVWTYLSLSLLPSTDGESKLFLAIIEDITERKHTELKLRHSKEAAEAGSRAKSEFLATMSHELRTPLNAIMGLSQLLLQNIVGEINDKQKEYVSCIYTSGEHLLALINDILDLSKVEAGREELLLAPLVIQDLCQIVISTISDRAQEKGLEVAIHIDPEAQVCIADERRLKQMLLNLLTNAVKFTPKGKISLTVEKVRKGINFIVTDTGIGIDSSQFKSLFEPFKQLDSRLKRNYEGTGLGLALTRKLAQLHGGDITLKSKLGEGSSFNLFLPDRHSQDEWGIVIETNSQDDDTENISTNSLLNARTKRIALVEDEVTTANLLQDYLQTFGYRVELFQNTEDFLTQIGNYLPDLILLSAYFSGSNNGWDLLVQIRQQKNLQDLPIIIMIPMGTTKEYPKNLQSDESKMKILEEAGAIDYLSKPIRTLQLESILMQYLS